VTYLLLGPRPMFGLPRALLGARRPRQTGTLFLGVIYNHFLIIIIPKQHMISDPNRLRSIPGIEHFWVGVYNYDVAIRKDILTTGNYYHIFVRSIAGYVVFNNDSEYSRLIDLLELCRFPKFNINYFRYERMKFSSQIEIRKSINGEALIETVAFCIMPTHIHLLLKQNADGGISEYMKRMLISYTKSFNNMHKRTGPLWASRFKNVLIEDDEQLLHLTRYIHLNPTSAGLAKKPEEWKYSSYNGYISKNNSTLDRKLFNISPRKYRSFVEDRKSYQRQLSIIKALLIEDYTGLIGDASLLS